MLGICYSAAFDDKGTDDKLRFSIKAKNERDCVVRIGFAGWVLVLLCSVATPATSKSNAAPSARVGHALRARQKRDDAKLARSLSKSYVLVGAGDIAGCSSLAGAAATAKLIEQIPGTVLQFARRAGLLRVLGRTSGAAGQGILQLRLGKMACGGAQYQLRCSRSRGMWGRLRAGKMAQERPRGTYEVMHCGVRTSCAFQQRTIQAACVASGVARFLEGFVRSSCGLNAGRARTFL